MVSFFRIATNPFCVSKILISKSWTGDERILGDSDFVETVLGSAKEGLRKGVD